MAAITHLHGIEQTIHISELLTHIHTYCGTGIGAAWERRLKLGWDRFPLPTPPLLC